MNDVEDGLLLIEPKNGVLRAGETASVTFQFNHTSLGFHKIPLFLKIHKGREFYIDFFGTTLLNELVSLPCIPKCFNFAPIPIGSIDPPVQLMEVLNGGSHPCHYQVNLQILQQFKKNYFDFPVFKCLNPKGEIPPFSNAMLQWVFSPLEARQYSINISVCVNDSADYVTRLVAVGYDERVMNDTLLLAKENGDFDIRAVLPAGVEKQEVELFPEHIQVGIVPVNSRVRRLAILKNNSESKFVLFMWNYNKNVISVSPSEGTIYPQNFQVFKIQLKSENVPILNEIDMTCNITDKAEYRQYVRNMKLYEKNKIKIKDEFIIEDKSTKNLTNVTIGVHENEKMDKNFLVRTKGSVKARPLGDKLDEPLPPQVKEINVRLTHRTMGVIEYERRFPHKINSWLYFNSVLDFEENKILEWNQAAKDMILPILSTVIRCIMSQNNFLNLISEIEKEPIPSFISLTGESESSDRDQNVRGMYENNGLVLMLERMMDDVIVDFISQAKNEDFSITKQPYKIDRY